MTKVGASRALHLCCALADRSGRREAALALARELGAEALLILLPDPETGTLLPAQGFPQTLPGGRAWVELLQRCRSRGQHEGEVPYPTPTSLRRARALTTRSGMVFLLLGGNPELPDEETLALPLLTAALHAEGDAEVCRGILSVERESSRHANALAGALDKARREIEEALSEAARLNEALEAAARERADLLTSEQAANRAKDEFLAMLGHELRNPLAPIATALELIKRREGSTPSREYAVIERQVTHLTGLVEDLLDVSRIARGKVTLKPTIVELGVVVQRAIEIASPLLESNGHHLELDVPAEGLLLEADEGRLSQVISNLLTNAARYTPPGGRIDIRAGREGDRITLRVKDTGIGIEASRLQNIFQPFVQGARPKDRRDGGLGLGLALVKSLVDMHGGTVTAHSEGLGKGAELVIELTATSRTASATSEDRAPEPDSIAAPVGDARKVLIVDDNEDAADLLGEMLALRGYEVAVCYDAPRALERIERFVPDVAILDIGLPVMDGHELARRLRSIHPDSGLRLIAVTGYGQEQDRAASRAAGFDHHLVKPITSKDVLPLLG